MIADNRRVRGTRGVWACPECNHRCTKDKGCPVHIGDAPVYFDSTGEYKRWIQLQNLQSYNTISKLRRQVQYPVSINDTHVCSYYADFVYFDALGNEVVEDFKGWDTDYAKLKRKLVEAVYRITIVISRRPSRRARSRRSGG